MYSSIFLSPTIPLFFFYGIGLTVMEREGTLLFPFHSLLGVSFVVGGITLQTLGNIYAEVESRVEDT